MNSKTHWETVYARKKPTEVSWYEARPNLSLELIRRAKLALSDPIIDVGGGTSHLVDELVAQGHSDITVLDVSGAALEDDRARIGTRASTVIWIEADVLSAELPDAHYALWHDRALFHFLTDAGDRARYVHLMKRATRPEAHVVLATFASDGPTRCSGLDVARYGPEELQAELGAGFQLLVAERDEHLTPARTVQPFTYCLFRRQDAS